ncbi:MAG: DUF4097 domain-containing protein, partial [Chloroflexota bacterium]|nr:DUF4097 domain-containing protein [Chloroflexota bacterium]
MTDRSTEEGPTMADDDRGEVRMPLDLARPVELTVANPNGDVRIRATDRGDALLRYAKHGRAGTRRYDNARLVTESTDNRIDVRVHIPSGGGRAELDLDIDLGNFNPFKGGIARAEGGIGRAFAEAREVVTDVGRAIGSDGVRFDLELEVPRTAETRTAVRTASGDVAVEDLAGPITVATASGDARVRGARGELSFQTASGDLLVERVAGRLAIRTASGDARVVGATLESFEVQTASGDVNVEAVLAGDGPYHTKTVSGDVRLALAAPGDGEPNLSLALKTVSGDANVAAPFRKTDRRAWQAGSGWPHVAVQTVSGDLHARLARAPT